MKKKPAPWPSRPRRSGACRCAQVAAGTGHAPGHRLMYRFLCAGLRHRLDQATGACRRHRSHPGGVHGLPRSARTACAWLRHLSPPTRRPACCCARSRCAVFTTSMAGMPSKIVANSLFADGAGAVVALRRARPRPTLSTADCRGGLDRDPRIRRRHVLADRRPWLSR